jgi:hypothetical protein
MAWDSSRPVAWQRLTREWLIYAAIMIAIVLLVFDADRRAGMIVGVLVSGPLYLGFGAILAKFGYQRKSLKEMRSERATAPEPRAGSTPRTPGPRAKPAPTKRTSTGPNRPRRTRR